MEILIYLAIGVAAFLYEAYTKANKKRPSVAEEVEAEELTIEDIIGKYLEKQKPTTASAEKPTPNKDKTEPIPPSPAKKTTSPPVNTPKPIAQKPILTTVEEFNKQQQYTSKRSSTITGKSLENNRLVKENTVSKAMKTSVRRKKKMKRFDAKDAVVYNIIWNRKY